MNNMLMPSRRSAATVIPNGKYALTGAQFNDALWAPRAALSGEPRHTVARALYQTAWVRRMVELSAEQASELDMVENRLRERAAGRPADGD